MLGQGGLGLPNLAALAQSAGSTVALNTGMVVNGSVIFSLTVVNEAPQVVAPGLFVNQSVIYQPTVASVAPGVVAPGLFVNQSVFFAPVLAQVPAQAVAPGLFVNQSVFYAPNLSVAGAPIDVSLGLFVNQSVFYAPALTGAQMIEMALVQNRNVIPGPTLVRDLYHYTYPFSRGLGSDYGSQRPRTGRIVGRY